MTMNLVAVDMFYNRVHKRFTIAHLPSSYRGSIGGNLAVRVIDWVTEN